MLYSVLRRGKLQVRSNFLDDLIQIFPRERESLYKMKREGREEEREREKNPLPLLQCFQYKLKLQALSKTVASHAEVSWRQHYESIILLLDFGEGFT